MSVAPTKHERHAFTPPPIWVSFGEFAERFSSNLHRARLIEGLKLGCVELRHHGCSAVYIGGSFTSSKKYPGDYDACFNPIGVDADLDPLLFNSLFEIERKQKYMGDWLIGRPDDGAPGEWYRYLSFDDRTGSVHQMYGIKLHLNELIKP